LGNPVGLFDFLSKKGAQTPVQKLAVKVLDKRGMAPDRWDAIQALSKMDSEEAVEALLARFTFYTDPSITDQEEKESVFNSIVLKGAVAVPPVKRFLAKSEAVTWPLKMLDRLLPEPEVTAIVLEILGAMDTEYERDPQRKLQLLAALEIRRDPRVLSAVKPFLADVNETARFHAVGSVFAQEGADEARETLLERLSKEDSMRVKARILDGFAQRSWPVDPARTGKLPDGFSLDPQSVPRRR
jgi:HEAT repeat protein